MSLKLQEHQQEAYDNALKLYEEGRYAAVIFPTGCGKSFVTLKLIQDNIDKNILFLSPAQAINNQMDNYIIKWLGENVKTVDRNRAVRSVVPHFRSMLYQSLLSDKKSTKAIIENLNPDIIVMDEMHHLKTDNNGEDEQEENIWGQKVRELLDMYPNAKVLGLTATPERMDGINTVEKLFEGKIASEITLVEAMQSDKIHIKSPIYVPADYALGEKLEGILEEIEECKDEGKKKELKDIYEKMRKIVDEADGMSELFKKNITKKDGKYIVFCGSKEDMEAKIKQAKEWFGEIDEEPEIYAVASAYDNEKGARYNEQQIEQFEKSDSKHLKLLYSIDMLNEGLHVDDVSGVIMTRKTGSRLVYLQQLGRALSSDPNRETPIVFDLVNNYMTYNLYNEMKEKQEKRDSQEDNTRTREEGECQGSNDNDELEAFEQFRIKGQAQEFLTLLDDIENTLDNKIEYNGQYMTLYQIAGIEKIAVNTLKRNYKKTRNIYEAVKYCKGIKIEYNGEYLTLTAIARNEGITDTILKKYYEKTGDIYIAVIKSKEVSLNKIEYKGEQLTLGVIARQEGVDSKTLRRYYKKTGNIYEAVKGCKKIKPKESIEYKGEYLVLAAIAKQEGINASTLRRYYEAIGNIYEAVEQSKAVAKGQRKKIEYKGEQVSLKAIAEKEGIPKTTLGRYYEQIGNIYEAVNKFKMLQGAIDERDEVISYNAEAIALEKGTENLYGKEQEQQQLTAKRDAAKQLYEGAKTALENEQKSNEDNSGEGK